MYYSKYSIDIIINLKCFLLAVVSESDVEKYCPDNEVREGGPGSRSAASDAAGVSVTIVVSPPLGTALKLPCKKFI